MISDFSQVCVVPRLHESSRVVDRLASVDSGLVVQRSKLWLDQTPSFGTDLVTGDLFNGSYLPYFFVRSLFFSLWNLFEIDFEQDVGVLGLFYSIF